ncbi:hypothetical protein EQZ09_16200, partial [Clostridium perfringens]|nr:hypothetical protein [Clostridium perfringens]EGT4139325.1 hypothetical protein [Clostridium perfringens]
MLKAYKYRIYPNIE